MSEARLEALREMVSQDPDDAFSRYALAMQLKGLERRAEAIKELAALADLQPDYVPTYYQYGELLHVTGQAEQAAAVIQRGMDAAERAGDGHARSELEDLLSEVQDYRREV